MPQQSKYSDSQFEAIIFHQQVPENQRQQMAEQFTQVLLKSINGK
jgi:uncharacterized protein YejL (UPF0352 family)